MRNHIHQFLQQKIMEASASFLQQKTPQPDEPLEYYADEIFLLTLERCAIHFLENQKLRLTEKQTLLELLKDLKDEQMESTVIEKRLIDNLSKIKPAWGELFGTDRGLVYKTFEALKEWPCFTWHARLYYKQQRQHHLNHQLHTQSDVISMQQSQLHRANTLVQQQEKTTESLSQRAASQFITIQQLQIELQAAKQTIAQLKAQLNQHNTAEPLPQHFDF